jgi:predicted CDP-diglyceride synthetase/phosphatidate cytidylyltransferase
MNGLSSRKGWRCNVRSKSWASRVRCQSLSLPLQMVLAVQTEVSAIALKNFTYNLIKIHRKLH